MEQGLTAGHKKGEKEISIEEKLLKLHSSLKLYKDLKVLTESPL